eukprot:GILJ01009981.1.p1 GENE.GILJ01009981.1~~GILJ01009981.1.p1  ORF type:complete len:519 (+),score=53.94 GILJ01009981.1:80-1636(+)
MVIVQYRASSSSSKCIKSFFLVNFFCILFLSEVLDDSCIMRFVPLVDAAPNNLRSAVVNSGALSRASNSSLPAPVERRDLAHLTDIGKKLSLLDVQQQKQRPLVVFVMIVKNEAGSIRETVESVRPWVDMYSILDTGSSDGTPDLIRKYFGAVPGKVHTGQFVDFGTTRNEALRLAGNEAIFNFMLSGDESLHHGESFRKFLDARRIYNGKIGPSDEAFNIRVHYSHDVYDSTRVARTDSDWRYVGVTHEYMASARGNVGKVRIPEAYVLHNLTGQDWKKKKQRWEKDRELLEREKLMEPNNTRTAFYLAQTYECLHMYDLAFKEYQRRVDLKGWREEMFEAMMRRGRVGQHLGTPWPDIQQMWLDAFAFLQGERAEPLYFVAERYYSKVKSHHLAFIFALRASQIVFPDKYTLFVDKTIYDFKVWDLLGIIGFYVGEFEVGEAAVRKALLQKPDNERLKRNLAYYLDRKQKHKGRRLLSFDETDASAQEEGPEGEDDEDLEPRLVPGEAHVFDHSEL